MNCGIFLVVCSTMVLGTYYRYWSPAFVLYCVKKKLSIQFIQNALLIIFFVKFHDTEYFHAEQKTTTFIMNEKLMDLKLIMNFKRNWRGEHL